MLIQFAIFLITFLLGAFGFSQIVGTLYLKKLGGNGNTITIVFWTIVLIGYGVCMYYYLPQYIWTIIIAALLAFIMSGNVKKEATEKMQEDSDVLTVVNHICSSVSKDNENVTKDNVSVISPAPSKNISPQQSSYTKREKKLCAISCALFVLCCILGFATYFLQSDLAYYKAQNAKNENKLYLLKDYSEISQKALFFDKYAVIVGEDQYYYHTYDCPNTSSFESFWIYNTEAAVSRGYHPCPTCNPPKVSK